MKLQYENLALRQANKADAEQLASWWNDGAVMAHASFPNGLGRTIDEAKEKISILGQTNWATCNPLLITS